MELRCEVVKDLLPLYHDGVCSDSSKALVEKHLSDCGVCKIEMEKMENHTIDRHIQRERDDIVGRHAQAVKKKSLVTGLSIATVLAVPILVCLIVNLATGHALDWFFIVLTALMTLASVTTVPLVMEKHKGLWTLGCFTGSLILLLLTCCLYSGGDWFFVAVIPVLLGLSVLFGPYVANALPLKGFAARHKGLLVLTVDTVLLYAVITVSGLYEYAEDFWRPALLNTTLGLIFPWSLFVIIRYIKLNGFIRAGLCTITSGLYLSFLDDAVSWILNDYHRIALTDANLLVWNYSTTEANVFLLILLTGLVVGAGLLVVGLLRQKRGL